MHFYIKHCVDVRKWPVPIAFTTRDVVDPTWVWTFSCQELGREGKVVFFCFVFDLVQYKNTASGSLGSRREMKESGNSMATRKTRGTAQLFLAKAVAALALR